MKNIKLLFSLFVVMLVINVTSCSGDDDGDENGNSNSKCLKDDFKLEETNVNNLAPSLNEIVVSFDLTNNSNSNYNIQNGSSPINTTMIVTTTDGDTFETTNILLVNALSAGAKTNVDVIGTFGANKTFSSYEITLSCR